MNETARAEQQASENQKFHKDRKIQWYRCKIDPAVMKELMQRSDLQGFRQALGHLGLGFATGTMAYLIFLEINSATWLWSLPLLLLALFAHGTVCTFMGGAACHELMHRTSFKTKAFNEFFLRVFAFFGWWDHVWFRPSHIRHHQATVHDDYDGEVVLPGKLVFRDWRFWLGLLAWNPWTTWDILTFYAKRSTGRMDNEWYEFVLPENNSK